MWPEAVQEKLQEHLYLRRSLTSRACGPENWELPYPDLIFLRLHWLCKDGIGELFIPKCFTGHCFGGRLVAVLQGVGLDTMGQCCVT